jgi:hypothetical protein
MLMSRLIIITRMLENPAYVDEVIYNNIARLIQTLPITYEDNIIILRLSGVAIKQGQRSQALDNVRMLAHKIDRDVITRLFIHNRLAKSRYHTPEALGDLNVLPSQVLSDISTSFAIPEVRSKRALNFADM